MTEKKYNSIESTKQDKAENKEQRLSFFPLGQKLFDEDVQKHTRDEADQDVIHDVWDMDDEGENNS
ncbi:hypothetical protein ES703_87067 [subsurface metagenome]|nr:hypothetical protein [bacterium]